MARATLAFHPNVGHTQASTTAPTTLKQIITFAANAL
jgi:hypothetical protein